MGDTYIEQMVKRVTPLYLVIAKWMLIVLECFIILTGMMFFDVFILIIATALGFGIYFLIRRWDLEYEYIYQNGELVIDKIMSKAARKRVCTIDVQSMELMFKGTDHPEARPFREFKVKNFTTGCHDDRVYTIVVGGSQNVKVLFEPNEEIVGAIRMMAPRKVKQD